MFLLKSFLLLLIAGCANCAHAQSGNWPLFRGDANSSGVASTTLPAEPAIIWEHKVKEGSFESTPIIVRNANDVPIVVIGDLDGSVFSFELASGRLLWERKLGEIGFTAAAAYHDGKIFLGDFDGFFYCLDLDGRKRWTYQADGEINGSANFYKNMVLFGAQDGCLHAVHRDSGKAVWKYQADDQIQCSTTVVDNRAFLAGCDGKLHIVNLDTGKEAAKVEIESPTGTTPAAVGDRVFFGTQQGTFLAIDWKEAKVVWKREDPLGGTSIFSSAAANKLQVIYGVRNRQVISLDPKTGSEKWIVQLKSKVDSSPVIVDDRVLIGSTDGRLYLLNLKDGAMNWETQLNGAIIGAPAVAYERLVVATDRGRVYCLGTAAE